MSLSEAELAILGVIIGGLFGFTGALVGIFSNVFLDIRKARRERRAKLQERFVDLLAWMARIYQV